MLICCRQNQESARAKTAGPRVPTLNSQAAELIRLSLSLSVDIHTTARPLLDAAATALNCRDVRFFTKLNVGRAEVEVHRATKPFGRVLKSIHPIYPISARLGNAQARVQL